MKKYLVIFLLLSTLGITIGCSKSDDSGAPVSTASKGAAPDKSKADSGKSKTAPKPGAL